MHVFDFTEHQVAHTSDGCGATGKHSYLNLSGSQNITY
jgi:hypothetical protein